jgi:hypothetical protein
MAKGIKTGGREVGTPNHNTAEIRNLINQFISNNWESVQTDFDKLEPKDRLQFYERLMQYAVPKIQAQYLEVKEKREIKFPEWFNEGGTP